MSRTKKEVKPPGYEYWSGRGGKKHGEEPGPFTKKKTHRKERRKGKADVGSELPDK